jgi:hypothetical protein
VERRYAPEAAKVINATSARSTAAAIAKLAAVHSSGNNAISSATSRGNVCR